MNKEEIEKIVKNYAHDFRDMVINEVNLYGILKGMSNEIMGITLTYLIEEIEKEKASQTSIVHLTNPPQYPDTNSEEYCRAFNLGLSKAQDIIRNKLMK